MAETNKEPQAIAGETYRTNSKTLAESVSIEGQTHALLVRPGPSLQS